MDEHWRQATAETFQFRPVQRHVLELVGHCVCPRELQALVALGPLGSCQAMVLAVVTLLSVPGLLVQALPVRCLFRAVNLPPLWVVVFSLRVARAQHRVESKSHPPTVEPLATPGTCRS